MKNALLALLLSGAMAATSFASINQREHNQQQRIGAGIRDGSVNAREASHLENREYNINRDIHFDRATDNGRLTRGERFQINRQQNRLSNSIYRDRHN